jgi:hypothetical protein
LGRLLTWTLEQYALTKAGYLTVENLQRFDEIQAVGDLSNIEQFLWSL